MYYIFDNDGKTLDRYTLINKDGDVYGFSENPFLGFGQFSHNTDDATNEFTSGGRKQFIAEALADKNWLGKRIKLKDLPEEAQKFVLERIK